MEQSAYRLKLAERVTRVLEAYDTALASDHDAVRLAAARAIEDRLFGRAKETVEVQADTRTEAELLAAVREKARLLGVTLPITLPADRGDG